MPKRKLKIVQPSPESEALNDIWFLLGGDAWNLHPLTPAQVVARVQQVVREHKVEIEDAIDDYMRDYDCDECVTLQHDLSEAEEKIDELTEELEELKEEHSECPK